MTDLEPTMSVFSFLATAFAFDFLEEAGDFSHWELVLPVAETVLVLPIAGTVLTLPIGIVCKFWTAFISEELVLETEAFRFLLSGLFNFLFSTDFCFWLLTEEAVPEETFVNSAFGFPAVARIVSTRFFSFLAMAAFSLLCCFTASFRMSVLVFSLDGEVETLTAFFCSAVD